MSSHKSRSCGFRKVSLNRKNQDDINQQTYSLNQPKESLIKEDGSNSLYQNTNTKSSQSARKKNQLRKLEVLSAIRGLSTEQLLQTCRIYGINTRRAVGRKVQALTKLYRAQHYLFAADFPAPPAAQPSPGGSSSSPSEAEGHGSTCSNGFVL